MPVKFPSPVEFISAVNINPSNELNRLNQAEIDLPFFRRYVNALEDAGFDYTMCAYASAFQDQFAIATLHPAARAAGAGPPRSHRATRLAATRLPLPERTSA